MHDQAIRTLTLTSDQAAALVEIIGRQRRYTELSAIEAAEIAPGTLRNELARSKADAAALVEDLVCGQLDCEPFHSAYRWPSEEAVLAARELEPDADVARLAELSGYAVRTVLRVVRERFPDLYATPPAPERKKGRPRSWRRAVKTTDLVRSVMERSDHAMTQAEIAAATDRSISGVYRALIEVGATFSTGKHGLKSWRLP